MGQAPGCLDLWGHRAAAILAQRTVRFPDAECASKPPRRAKKNGLQQNGCSPLLRRCPAREWGVVRKILACGFSGAWVTLQLRVPKPASRVPELARAAVRGVFAGVWARSERTALVTASVASRIRCRRLRAAIGAQRKAQRAAHTELYWQAMQRRDALRWPAQTDR